MRHAPGSRIDASSAPLGASAAVGDNAAMSAHPFGRRRLPAVLASCLLAAACAAAPAAAGTAAKPHAAAPAHAPALPATLVQRAQDVAIAALGLIGVDYRFGGDDPASGFDCSGLVRYVFSQTTGIALPRTSAEMGRVGARIARVDLLPGDLVFFNTRHFADSHVGIYLGDNRFVHAPSRGSEVRIASLDDAYWKRRFTGARRLVGVIPLAVAPPPSAAAVSAVPAPAVPARESTATSSLAMILTRADLTQ
jgi:cell wall-associated NlpC family hydrolase